MFFQTQIQSSYNKENCTPDPVKSSLSPDPKKSNVCSTPLAKMSRVAFFSHQLCSGFWLRLLPWLWKILKH